MNKKQRIQICRVHGVVTAVCFLHYLKKSERVCSYDGELLFIFQFFNSGFLACCVVELVHRQYFIQLLVFVSWIDMALGKLDIG